MAVQAAALGFAIFELLDLAGQAVAAQIDRTVFLNVTSTVRERLLYCRAWELYRTSLSCIAGACAGWIVARIYRWRRTVAVASVAVVLAISLLISLLTGPGYYLRDFVLMASIIVSPLVGGLGFGRHTNSTQE